MFGTGIGPTQYFHRLAVVPLAVLTLAGVAACDSDSKSSSTAPSTTGTTAPAGDSAKECVTDVDKVIATKPTAAMTSASLPTDLVAKLDAAAQSSFKEAAAPGAIVGVRSPQGTWIMAYGVAEPSGVTKPVTGKPMTADMHTRIGSVTKTFTGTVILQLVQQRKLSLNDPIDKYFPGVPNGDKITLRHLATMTSGIASYTKSTKFTDVLFARPQTSFTPDELIAIGLSESPIFPPGERFDYSNTNTHLLGKVIEKVTGEPVEDVFKKMIFDPLGLANTSWPAGSTAIPEPYPQGFTLQGDTATPENPSNATNWNPSWGWTSGELISNMPDLLTYGRALGTGQGLLDPATQAERLRSVPGPSGYGITMGCDAGWVGHGGELPGYNTSLFYDTASDTTVVVQTNSDIPSGDCPAG
ncbi:MAG TPA: serine hydrolase domain-containing protein, partial [Acidimicrobiales bacterium]